MRNEQLIKYIKESLAIGKSAAEIQKSLFEAGWADGDINENFNLIFGIQENPSGSEEIIKSVGGELKNVRILLKESFKIYKKKFKSVVIIAALSIIIFAGSELIIVENTSNVSFQSMALIVYFLQLFLPLISLAAIILTIANDISLKTSYQQGAKFTFHFLWTFLLYCAIIIVFLVPIVIFTALLPADFTLSNQLRLFLQGNSEVFDNFYFTRIKTLTLIWYSALIVSFVLAIIFAFLFSFFLFTVVFENKNGLNALLRSKDLIKGKFLAVFWRVVSGSLIISVVSFLLFFIIALILYLIESSHDESNLYFIVHLAYYISLIFVMPFFLVYLYLIYNNLRTFKKDVVYIHKRLSRIIYLILGIIGVPVIIFPIFIGIMNVITKDIPLPDDSDLRLSKVEIKESDNFFNDFMAMKEIANFEKGEGGKITDIVNGKNFDPEFIKNVSDKNVQALSYLEIALNKPYYQNLTYQDPDEYSMLSKTYVLNPATILLIVRLDLLKTFYLSDKNDSKDFFDHIFKVIKIGHTMENSQSTLLDVLIGRGIKMAGFKFLQQRAIVESNLSKIELLDYAQKIDEFKENRKGFINAFKLEYLNSANTLDIMEKESVEKSKKTTFHLPSQEIRMNYFYYRPNQMRKMEIDNTRVIVNNFMVDCDKIKPIQPMISELKPSWWKLVFKENTIGEMLIKIKTVILNSKQLAFNQCFGDFSLGATKLLFALRAYQSDNQKLPSTLLELVPQYISEIPKDPFDDQELKYDANKKIIYSIGKDLQDSGGSEGKEIEVMADPTIKIEF